MANPLNYFLVFALSLVFLLPFKASSTSHDQQHKLKTLSFDLFQHETINKTGYIIVNGVTGPEVSRTTTPFGTIFVFQDPMTITPNRSSKLMGIAEGTSITSSSSGLQSISVAKITLNMKQYKGSVSVLGGTHNTKPAAHHVVGGTGDFMFVQGFVTTSPLSQQFPPTFVYKVQFRLFWPPYAVPASYS